MRWRIRIDVDAPDRDLAESVAQDLLAKALASPNGTKRLCDVGAMCCGDPNVPAVDLSLAGGREALEPTTAPEEAA